MTAAHLHRHKDQGTVLACHTSAKVCICLKASFSTQLPCVCMLTCNSPQTQYTPFRAACVCTSTQRLRTRSNQHTNAMPD
mmetsp:Transcript_23093/g.50697  ORF Transcript_23093/g.50697 Transcript_23093/m.50697 type:complete len:80 (-) Transcript_23093:3107-3346(-)